MAKLNVTVDNDLDNVNLISHDELEGKKKEKKGKEVQAEKPKKEKKVKTKKDGYLKQVAKEMKLVTWPSKKDLVKYSIATIVMIIVLSFFFMGVNALFDLLYGLVQGWIG